MNSFQIFLIVIIVLYILLKAVKFFRARNIKNYSAAEAANELKNSKNVIMLDVRTNPERERGFIKGSIHIPLHQIKTSAEQLKKFKDKEIICYCQSGSRSISAAITLTQMGFNAANMTGGFNAWVY